MHNHHGDFYDLIRKDKTKEEIKKCASQYGFPIDADDDVLGLALSYGKAFSDEGDTDAVRYFMTIISCYNNHCKEAHSIRKEAPMKVLIINGSPRTGGNTSIALSEMEKVFEAEGVESESIQIGNKDIRGCIACGSCYAKGKCAFDDIVNELAPKLEAADGLVVASPVYYASANATLIACLDRLFYSTHFDKTMKVGASVAVARRGGCSATFDELNKYFTISGMPVASSQYWNSIHGREKGEARQDLEGMQTMRTLARNMAFLMKSIALGKEKYGLPEKEEWQPTHFIR